MSEELNLKPKRRGLLEAAVLVPNVILLGIIVIYLVISRGAPTAVEPVLKTDRTTASRISQLERLLKTRPSKAGVTSLELAQLYNRAGGFPWSVDALRSAERTGGLAPSWRMKLGLAYLDLGKNLDGLRVLKGALQRCAKIKCLANIQGKLEIFTRLAELLIERRIDARKNQVAAARVIKDVLKRVRPDRMSRLIEKAAAKQAAAKEAAAKAVTAKQAATTKKSPVAAKKTTLPDANKPTKKAATPAKKAVKAPSVP